MIPTLSHFLLIMAWLCAAQGLASGIICTRKQNSNASSLLTFFFDAMLGCIWASAALLVYSYLRSDFSLMVVFEHVQTNLPWYYRVGAIWAGHEGSMMLWLVVLTLWSAVFRFVSLPEHFKQVSITMLLTIFVALLAFILLASSPFDRLLPFVPMEGQDLNPLLQDLGMMFHPPLLYLGYVGFAVPYAMVLARLISPSDDVRIEAVFKKVVLTAWGFLTIGITLGSFWAYYELGWGGFWFWDPVENASLLPWLVATALVHAMMMPAAKHRGSMVDLLTIWAFVLSLLGTFLVRSGLLSSVHSFASDPARGLFILLMVLFFWGMAHVLYFKHKTTQPHQGTSVTSRESFLTLNQMFFLVIAATVFLGTIYPLIVEAMGLGFISVGPQYFNRIILPIGGVLTAVMGLSVASRFRHALVFAPQLIMALIALIAAVLPEGLPILARVGIGLFTWVFAQTARDLFVTRLSIKRLSMHMAHMGFATLVLGIALSQTGGVEKENVMSPGDAVSIAGSTITLQRFDEIAGPNFEGVEARMHLDTPGEPVVIMKPEKRFYTFRGIALSETAIDGNLRRDWYIALGEPLENNAWSFRIQYKPFIRLIWLGGLMMALGMFMAVGRMLNDESR
ncbi:MAG: heme lyase CcmF/NrfE family subunit [Gammaproteobacteria bacterium]